MGPTILNLVENLGQCSLLSPNKVLQEKEKEEEDGEKNKHRTVASKYKGLVVWQKAHKRLLAPWKRSITKRTPPFLNTPNEMLDRQRH